LPRQLGELTGPLGEQRVASQSEGPGAVRELGPAAAGGAVLGGRIDEEDGLANGQ
jgi:hypothetical protein